MLQFSLNSFSVVLFSKVVPGSIYKSRNSSKAVFKMKVAVVIQFMFPVALFQFQFVLDRSIKAGMVIQRQCLR
jgi:hypothetical protein